MDGAIVFDGPEQVSMFRAMAVESGMRFYLKTGWKVNRMYTPANMMRVATEYTGKVYKRNGLAQAQADLATWLASKRPRDTWRTHDAP